MEGSRITITGTDVPVSGSALTSLALLLHELTTNAAKHGALSRTTGHLVVDVCSTNGSVHLTWFEEGVLRPQEVTNREGFGTTLEKAVLEGLGGALLRDWKQEGLVMTITMPLEKLVE